MSKIKITSTFVAQRIDSMLGALITSKTRLKLLIKFFVLTENTGYLRGIAEEFDESTNAIRKELNQLTQAGFLEKKQEKKKILYKANTSHPLFGPVQRLVHSFLGVDRVIDQVLTRAGELEEVILVGAFAKGQVSDKLEIVVLGQELNINYLVNVANKTAKLIDKTIELSFEKPKQGSCIVLYRKK